MSQGPVCWYGGWLASKGCSRQRLPWQMHACYAAGSKHLNSCGYIYGYAYGCCAGGKEKSPLHLEAGSCALCGMCPKCWRRLAAKRVVWLCSAGSRAGRPGNSALARDWGWGL
jgi:hypothetical protein